ncbi:MFS transporter [Paraburkholderia hospita]|uniref:MFS transporter n=1 Tax=Paraburkholderia hospita TaxID=169430 RepID=UPI0009A65117|nr:MFS transporter [Paraburkholderia hospita]SKC99344.1 benzoate transport [Paraburkholderia hospita]
MTQAHLIDVRSFIDVKPFGRRQIGILALIFSVIACDGMDIGIMGFAAPEILRTWKISKAEMGSVLSSVFFGMAAGAAIAGPIGDRFGRKILVAASVIWFGLTTLLSALAPNVSILLAIRALTGIGLGAAIPGALALLAEYAPRRKRSLALTIAYSGFTAGATLTGLSAAWLIPVFGWKITLFLAGLLSLVLAGYLIVLLPESVSFLALKQRTTSIPRILGRIFPGTTFPSEAQFWLPRETDIENRKSALLSPRYAITAAMLAVCYFMGTLVTYIIVGWLPVLSRSVGYSLAEGAIVTAQFTLAGPLGSVCVGYAMDRMNGRKILMATFLISAILLAISSVAKEFIAMAIFMLTLGFFFHGTMTGLQALAPQSFPTSARASGISFMHVAGRLGAIGSGALGGFLLELGWSFSRIFVTLSIPMLIGLVAMMVIYLQHSTVKQGGLSQDDSNGKIKSAT